MADFTDTSGNTLSNVSLVVGHRRIRFDGGRGASAPTITSSNNSVVEVTRTTLFSGPSGIFTVDISAKRAGTATITGTVRNGQSSAITIVVSARVSLPARNTTGGLVVRLLLNETMSPSNSSYNAVDAEKGMNWMVVVLNNRLNDPRSFGAPAGATIEQIIKARNQFAGFQNFPQLSASTIQHIQGVVNTANDNNNSNQSAFQNHITFAIAIANAHQSPIADPASPDELIGWRTSGHGSPGGSAVAFSVPLLGNQFFKR